MYRPACTEVNYLRQELTRKKYWTSEQHKEMGFSRQNSDQEDTLLVIEILEKSNQA